MLAAEALTSSVHSHSVHHYLESLFKLVNTKAMSRVADAHKAPIGQCRIKCNQYLQTVMPVRNVYAGVQVPAQDGEGGPAGTN